MIGHISISLPPEMLSSIDEKATRMKVSRSAVIVKLLDVSLFLEGKKEEFITSNGREKFEKEMNELFVDDRIFEWLKTLSYQKVMGIESAAKNERYSRRSVDHRG